MPFTGPRTGWSAPSSRRVVLATVLVVVLVGTALLAVLPIDGYSGLHGTSGRSPPSSGPSAGLKVLSQTILTPTFYGNNSTFGAQSAAHTLCATYNVSSFGTNYSYRYCLNEAQNPTVLTLANGNVAVGYSAYSTQTSTACAGARKNVTSDVFLRVSTDGGHTFAAPLQIANRTCAYLQSIEPSFAVSGSTTYAVFVEENASNSTNAVVPVDYGFNRSTDGLGFVNITGNGAIVGNVQTLVRGNAARPLVATFGSTIYVLYRNNSNSSLTLPVPYPDPSPHPSALELLVSTNKGTSWTGPIRLPGLGAAEGYDIESPAIAVNATGAVAVAYATNRSCLAISFGYCYEYGYELVSATSTNNGTMWSTPSVIARNVGESQCLEYYNDSGPAYWFDCYAYLIQFNPQLSLTWGDTNPGTLYLAWSGSKNSSSPYPYDWYSGAGLFSARSTNAGTTWTNATVQWLNTSVNQNYFIEPSLKVRGGTLYLAYTWNNQSFCYFGCGAFDHSISFWLTNSTDGLTWAPPALLSLDEVEKYNAPWSWIGYADSVGFTGAGSPVIAYSQMSPTSFAGNCNATYTHCWDNYTAAANLTDSFLYTGPTVAVNFTENGLAPGTPWSFHLNGILLGATTSSINVTNVPKGALMIVEGAGVVPTGYRTQLAAYSSAPVKNYFQTYTVVFFNYTTQYGIVLSFTPQSIPGAQIFFFLGATFYDTYDNGVTTYTTPAFPWFFNASQSLPLINGLQLNSFYVPVIYFNGTGAGSFTGYGTSATLTVASPFNETVWLGVFGVYNETFSPEGLPASSTFSFSFAGGAHSGPATGPITVANVGTGAYPIGSIQATSTKPGWEYFGFSSTGPTVVVPTQLFVNLSFAFVNLSAPVGLITFHATGLANGDYWQLSFNGTVYSSTTPWINVSDHPGTYPAYAFPVSNANDTAGYTPTGFGPTVAVTTATTYSVDFVPAYRVLVLSGAGGSVSGAGTYYLPVGATPSYTAAPSASYAFNGWTGSGLGSYTGGSPTASLTVSGTIIETASFVALPNYRFNLTVQEVGLSRGTWWTVVVGGNGYSTNRTSLIVPRLLPCSAGPPGQYSFNAPDAYQNSSSGPNETRFFARSPPTTICTTGSTVLTLNYGTQFLITPLSTVGGTGFLALNGIPLTAPAWVTPSVDVVGLEALPWTGYVFDSWVGSGPGNYTGINPTVQLFPAGPITEIATFSKIYIPPPPTYNVSVHETTALAVGTAWSLTLGSTDYTSTTAWINITGLASGSYPISVATVYSPDGLSRYAPSTVNSPVVLGPDQTITVNFGVSYWLEVGSTAGGSASPSSEWVAAGGAVALAAIAAPGYEFVAWQGSGTGSYSGSSATDTILVNGPIVEEATFGPIPPPASSAGPFASLGSPGVLVAFGVVGLAAGLLVGAILSRRRTTGGERASSRTLGTEPESGGAAGESTEGGEEQEP